MRMTSLFFALSMMLSTAVMANGYPIFGEWQTPCYDKSKEDSPRSEIWHATFNTDNTYSWKFKRYGDKTCATPKTTVEYPGTFTVVGDKEGGVGFDIVLTAYNFTVHDAAMVESLNKEKYCGFEDWAVDVTKNLGGVQCGESKKPGTGETYYDLYKIVSEEGKADTVTFGAATEDKDGSSAEKRPTTLDADHVYTRQ